MAEKSRLLSQPVYKKIYSKVPRTCIDLVIEKDGGVVLVKRGGRDLGPGRGEWHLPGKTIIYGETVRHAIHRTATDETSLKVKVKKFMGFHEYKLGTAFGNPISLVFLVKATGGKLHDSDNRDVKVFTKLPKNVGFSQKKILRGAGFR